MKILDQNNTFEVKAGEHVLVVDPTTGETVELVAKETTIICEDDGATPGLCFNTADSFQGEWRDIPGNPSHDRYSKFFRHLRINGYAAVARRSAFADALASGNYRIDQ